MNVLTMSEQNLTDKRVMIREDLNVPLKDGNITNDKRIQAALPTIKLALQAGAKVILLSHLGRPKEGEYDEQFSLAPIATRLAELLSQPVRLEKNWLDGFEINSGEVVLCENVRFNVGEKKCDPDLAKQMAKLCDVFVMDAFASSHRQQASTYGVAEFAPIACAGPLLSAELTALAQATAKPKHPVVAVIGGAKVSGKLPVLESLANLVEVLIVGGGIANTFIAASGHSVGKSLYEPELVSAATSLLKLPISIPMPVDVLVASEFSEQATARVCAIDAVAADEMILDIGPKTAQQFAEILQQAGTILWNGPVGVFEFAAFSQGTAVVAEAIATSSAFSIAGGGDTLAAIDKFNIAQQLSYISTGGGAFLEFLEGKKLPAVAILEQRAMV